ncbi:MAG TPA: tetratricopeptide repeat protein [Pyrinomonadaceae bacterium]|jgi:hypothetical protein
MNARRLSVFQKIGRRFSLAALLLCLCLSGAHAQDAVVKDSRYYIQQAVTAYRAKDYGAYLENLKQALTLRPEHPVIMYNMAGAYALNGKTNEALSLLGTLAESGLIFPTDDEDFASLKSAQLFKEIVTKFEANKAAVTHSAQALTLDEKGLVTESVAYDAATATFYVSSVHKRKIVSIDAKGLARDFSSASDGLWSALGMKVDARRRMLWVASAAMPQMMHFSEADKNRTGVFKYDLKTGKLIKKYLLPDTTKGHVFGDLVVHSSGDVYVTDSVTPDVYVITARKDELEHYAGPEGFISPQGLDFSGDEKKLFMSDYLLGLFVFDLKTNKLTKLEHADNISLFGLDGIYFYKGSLIAVQNGTNPQRVVRLHLNPQMTRVERLELIESNNPVCDEPTLGVISKDSFYFIANSQWSTVNEKGEQASEDKLRKPVILKTKL